MTKTNNCATVFWGTFNNGIAVNKKRNAIAFLFLFTANSNFITIIKLIIG